MTEAAPTTQAEQEDAVRADLIAFFQDRYWQVPRLIVDEVDALLAGPLATLRARAAAAETERDEARQRADDLFWTITEPAKAARHWQMKATAAEAQRDQLAADLRKAREALSPILVAAQAFVDAETAENMARIVQTEAVEALCGADANVDWLLCEHRSAADRTMGKLVARQHAEAELMRAARAALTPDPKDAGGTAKGDDHGA